MMRKKLRRAEVWLQQICAMGSLCALSLLLPQDVQAAFLTYELEGNIITPIYASTYGREKFTGYYYAQFINKGDLKMVIDNSNGRVSITGRTYGCVVASGTDCSSSADWKFGADQVGKYNVNYGWGYFDWNLYMTGGRGAYGSDADNPVVVFERMDPDIGHVQVVNADPSIKEYIGVGAKYSQDHGFALAVTEGANTKDGLVHITAWLEHQYGVLGGHARAESDRNSTVANTWLVGYEVRPEVRHHPRRRNPPTEVPEPASLFLLGSGMAGLIARKRGQK